MKIKYSKVKINTFETSKKTEKYTGTSKREKGPIFYLLYFLLVVGVFILVALLARFVFLYQKSTFNTSGYSVLVTSEKPFIVALDKGLNHFSIVNVPSVSKDRIGESLKLGMPIDAQITATSLSPENISSIEQILSFFFKPWGYKYQDMNALDGFKMVSFASSVPKKEVKHFTISLSKTGDVGGVTSEELYNVFKDSQIVDEQKSIEIVNSTSITGLAGLLGQVLKNVGGNVVSIKSGEETGISTLIASSNSQTLKRISRLTGIKPIIDENMSSVADIQIILGSDFGKKAGKM